MQNIEDRRAFLHTLGISVPVLAVSAITAEAAAPREALAPVPPPRRDPRDRLAGEPIIRVDEVFVIYVSEALSHLPDWLTREPGSTLRTIIEAQAAGLAAVIAEIERRQ